MPPKKYDHSDSMSVNFQSSDIEPVIRVLFLSSWHGLSSRPVVPYHALQILAVSYSALCQVIISEFPNQDDPSTWKNMEAHQPYQDVCAAIAGSLRVSPFDGFLPCPHQRQVLQLLARLQLQEPETRWNKVQCMEPIGAIREKMGKRFKSNDENWGGISKKGMRRRMRTTARGW